VLLLTADAEAKRGGSGAAEAMVLPPCSVEDDPISGEEVGWGRKRVVEGGRWRAGGGLPAGGGKCGGGGEREEEDARTGRGNASGGYRGERERGRTRGRVGLADASGLN
jgi:hypothetical protein